MTHPKPQGETGAADQKQKFDRVFINPENEDVVHFKMKRKHDYWVITSEELPGLFICSKKIDTALEQLGPAINGLFKAINNPTTPTNGE